MRKITLLCAAVLLLSMAVVAQDKTADFSGDWVLDTEKSELGGRRRIKSMKMKVTQTETELSYTREVEREAGGGGRGGRMGRGRGMGGNQTSTFDLTGKERIEPSEGRGGDVKLKAEEDGAGFKLTQSREFNGPMGAVTIITIEKWSLSEDGSTFTVQSDTETPRGTRSSTLVFTKVVE
ncbi:MAG: hypothetical protein HKN33_18130 [Pyrinomonadaceae bacterium]|nr:hypothetical protein [Pyrinomonadaceae bacterium]